ncbi:MULTISPECIES: MFS transporter [Streptomyces]|uniref:MFS transporter n=1 Tax=Streptomyces TaxID=1883 RepID=UPI00163C098B|nr:MULTISPECIES: MFS transporter [Streptomyces]MBC2876748.1 MFS transporter [Streptomyces sp. TYQ1024]UBI36376.1 MFS transporter [Streptomyces mobaraensis]UKW28970.1 MFS transporter [Streptomyces sp. TYQ1024]
MSSPYRAIFAAPGAKGFSAAGLFARMPLSMMGIGIVTMISEITGEYGLAGALSAALALATAAMGPQVSRLVDRYGQRRVLRPATLFSVAATACLLLGARLRWPHWTLFVLVIGVGAVPSVGAMVRARWAALYQDSPGHLHTAYSAESVIDELVFIVGPVLAIGLSTGWFPEAGPLLAGLFLLFGVFWLTSQRATEPPPSGTAHGGGGSALRSAGLRVLVGTSVALGALFGSIEVVTVAFAEELGHKALSSVVLAVWALGSCIAGTVFGLLRPKGDPARRWLVGVCAMAVSMIPLQLVGNLASLTVALFFAGLAIAPTMVTTMALVEQHVPRANLTEGMTWASTGMAVGAALGSSAAGSVVDALGAGAGYAVPGVAGALAAVGAFLGYRRLRSAPERVSRRTGTSVPRPRGGSGAHDGDTSKGTNHGVGEDERVA